MQGIRAIPQLALVKAEKLIWLDLNLPGSKYASKCGGLARAPWGFVPALSELSLRRKPLINRDREGLAWGRWDTGRSVLLNELKYLQWRFWPICIIRQQAPT